MAVLRTAFESWGDTLDTLDLCDVVQLVQIVEFYIDLARPWADADDLTVFRELGLDRVYVGVRPSCIVSRSEAGAASGCAVGGRLCATPPDSIGTDRS